jgi:hypothetical protein
LSRRREPRYAADLAVVLDEGHAVARNVSASGIYFETPLRFVEGERIRFRVEFTPEAGGPLTMQCQGRVVRIERAGEAFGIAARIEEFSFARAREAGDASA